MNPKYQKVLSDIEKAEKKKSEIEGQLKELYDKKTELENLEIINTVRSMVMPAGSRRKGAVRVHKKCFFFSPFHAIIKIKYGFCRNRAGVISL